MSVLLITFNCDAALFWLRVDPSAGDRPKTLSIGDYGIRRGVDRLLGLLGERQIPATWFIPGQIATASPATVDEIAAAGHELASRSWDLTPLGGRPYEEQYRLVRRGVEALEAITGHRPAGFRAPHGEVDAVSYAALRANGIRWSASMHSGDRPFVTADAVLEIPSPPGLNDYAYFEFNYDPAFPAGNSRISSYDAVLEEWCDDLQAHAAEDLPFVLTLSPHIIGKPGRALLLGQFLDFAASIGMPAVTVSRLLAESQSQHADGRACSDP